jgi:hypothetical protein
MLLQDDPIINIIINGIKRDIKISFENQCYRAVLILIYAGIDAMAYLNMAHGKSEVDKIDFIEWVEKYIHIEGETSIKGVEFYAARCSIIHSYGVHSRITAMGESRLISYMDKSLPAIKYMPFVNDKLVLVSIEALMNAFFEGIDKFIVDIFKDNEKAKIAKERFDHNYFSCFDNTDKKIME